MKIFKKVSSATRTGRPLLPLSQPLKLQFGSQRKEAETMTLNATPTPGNLLVSPNDHTLIMIDFQSQMAFATKSIDAVLLRNNAALVANAAAGFGVSTVLTTVAEKTFSGPMFSEITDAFPGQALLDRTSMNTWEDAAVIEEVNRIDRKRLVFCGLWTSVCIVGPTLSALDQGFEVYVIADACGDVSDEAHERAMDRMVQAGVRPMTSLQYMLELQRDWARTESYEMTTGIARKFGGAYGLGIIYAKSMFGASEGH
ncbi:Isochorismatase hydrolase [Sinorhizobium medicae]|uniref:Isochorismatase hydrolase n=1 Tax=Sinorhizobium medicae TaxID=110321 RepID=A0A508X6N7_9HYPH|nr:Isochorismatase hydrolase [Sinorhizobium medicae]